MQTQEEIIRAQGLQYTTPTQPTQTSETFLKTLQDRLLAQSDMISSSNTNLESKISEAISGLRSSAQSSTQAIESQYNREIGYTRELQDRQITAARERGVGMATTDVAYKAMTAEADKNLKDLEMRKQELILQGNAQAASKIAELQIQTLDFKTKAMQQTFTNLLSMGSFGLQAEESRRTGAQQDFINRSKIAEIGLQYGIPVGPNDTLESIVSKAAPKASEAQRVQLAKIIAETNKANAEANKAWSENRLPDLKDPNNLRFAGQTYRRDPASIVSKAKTSTEVGAIENEARTQEIAESKQLIPQIVERLKASNIPVTEDSVYKTLETTLSQAGTPLISPINISSVVSTELKKIPTTPSAKRPASLPEQYIGLSKKYVELKTGLSGYLTGSAAREFDKNK